MFDGYGSFLGGVAGGVASIAGQSSANRANARMAKEQMAFQGYQSNTAHQREVKDLEAAGLNPLISATGGASTSQGAISHMENEAQAGVSAAKELGNVISEIALKKQMKETAKAQGDLNTTQSNKNRTEEKILKHEEKARKAESQYRIDKANFDKQYIKADKYFNYGQKLMQGAATGAGILGGAQILKKTLPKNQMIINKKTGEIIRD
jgi:hypothetical protein